jgi:flagellar export protein FliJ
MAKFVFPLDRVLDYRRTQQRLEQSQLDQLTASLDGLLRRKQTLLDGARESRRQAALPGAQSDCVTLAPIEGYGRFVQAEAGRLDQQAAEIHQQIAAQRQRVIEAAQRCRLLEKLRQKRESEWRVEAAKKLENFAAEAFLARRQG